MCSYQDMVMEEGPPCRIAKFAGCKNPSGPSCSAAMANAALAEAAMPMFARLAVVYRIFPNRDCQGTPSILTFPADYRRSDEGMDGVRDGGLEGGREGRDDGGNDGGKNGGKRCVASVPAGFFGLIDKDFEQFWDMEIDLDLFLDYENCSSAAASLGHNRSTRLAHLEFDVDVSGMWARQRMHAHMPGRTHTPAGAQAYTCSNT